MPSEDFGTTGVPQRRIIPHYHGDEVKILFLIGAVVLVFAKTTGADLPLGATGSLVTAALLVVLAGITNPAQVWIHWANAALACAGTLLFGQAAVDRYQGASSLAEPSFIYIEALALISLLALYFVARTIRGLLLRPH